MAKTFEDLSGRTIEITDEFSVQTNEDIVTKKVSGYFVVDSYTDSKYEVDEVTYNAIKEYLEK